MAEAMAGGGDPITPPVNHRMIAMLMPRAALRVMKWWGGPRHVTAFGPAGRFLSVAVDGGTGEAAASGEAMASGDLAASGEAMERALDSTARMYADDQATKALRISIDEIAPGRATARMRVTPDMTNGHGIAHGGYIFLLADTAFAYACNTYGPVTVAQGGQITFLLPAREGDDLTASAAERVRMDRNGIYDVRVCRADGTILAEFRGQSRTVPGWRQA